MSGISHWPAFRRCTFLAEQFIDALKQAHYYNQRRWLQEIVAGRKGTEYREIKPYWTKKVKQVQAPFLLRLINGMQYRAPEVTVLIDKVRKNTRRGDYELRIQRIIAVRNWDRPRKRPAG